MTPAPPTRRQIDEMTRVQSEAWAANNMTSNTFERWVIQEFGVPSLEHFKTKVYSHVFAEAMELAWNAALLAKWPEKPGTTPDEAKFLEWWMPYQLPDGWIARIDLVAWHAWQAAQASMNTPDPSAGTCITPSPQGETDVPG